MLCSPSTHVLVSNHRCVSARSASKTPVRRPCADRTVPELFAMIRAWAEDTSGSTIEAAFDPTWGYPTDWHIQTNIKGEASDSQIRRFRAAR